MAHWGFDVLGQVQLGRDKTRADALEQGMQQLSSTTSKVSDGALLVY
jgi:hypothetical protein